MTNETREINPIQWFDDRDAVQATKDFRPRPEPASESESESIKAAAGRKEPAKD